MYNNAQTLLNNINGLGGVMSFTQLSIEVGKGILASGEEITFDVDNMSDVIMGLSTLLYEFNDGSSLEYNVETQELTASK